RYGGAYMNIRIVYATRTKHSQKLAEAMGERLKITPENIMLQPESVTADLLIIAGGIYGGESRPELLAYVKKLDANSVKCAALVTSCASGKQQQVSVRKILEENGIKVIDEFICKGGFLFVSARHPDSNDLKAAADFADKVVSNTKSIK
ncbi:MAG: flavodoxin domain-containing protein, partial [Eubacteriales bacterium]